MSATKSCLDACSGTSSGVGMWAGDDDDGVPRRRPFLREESRPGKPIHIVLRSRVPQTKKQVVYALLRTIQACQVQIEVEFMPTPRQKT